MIKLEINEVIKGKSCVDKCYANFFFAIVFIREPLLHIITGNNFIFELHILNETFLWLLPLNEMIRNFMRLKYTRHYFLKLF